MKTSTVLYALLTGCMLTALTSCGSNGPDPELPTAEIVVTQDSVDIPNDTGSYDFGTIGADDESGSSGTICGDFVPFTILNNGTTDLLIYGVTVSTNGGDNFDFGSLPASSIPPAGESTFSIRFDPGAVGSIAETVSIDSSDPDTGTYTFGATGRGVCAIDVLAWANTYYVNSVSLAADGSNVYALYCTSRSTSEREMHFATSADSGQTWDPADNVVIDTSCGHDASMLLAGSTLYVSYFDDPNNDLRFARSIDGGDTWHKTLVEAHTGSPNDIAVEGDNVYIAYYDFAAHDLKIAISADGGDTWDPGDMTTIDSTGWVGDYPSVAVDGTNVYIAYFDETNGLLKFARSTDGGATWPSENIVVVDTDGYASGDLDMAANGNTIYIAYETYRSSPTALDVKLAVSTDGGATWPQESIVSLSPYGDVPRIAVDGTTVYVSFDYGGIQLVKSTDGGVTFDDSADAVIDGHVSSWANALISNGTTLYACYNSLGESGTDVYDALLFSRSTDGGTSWY